MRVACSAGWPARTSAPARSRPRRTRSPQLVVDDRPRLPRRAVRAVRRGAAGRRASSRCWPAWRPASSTAHRGRRRRPAARPAPTKVGSLTLHPCDVLPRALCGSILRPWEPGNPAAGTVTRRLRVRAGARHSRRRSAPWCRTRAAPATARPARASSYAAMYGPLLDRRNLLLVDQRGTGRSEPIDCPALQDLTIAYARRRRPRAAARSARAPTTTRPRCSADDLAAVDRARSGLGQVDVYGDSYGTFFTAGLRRPPPRPGAQRRPRQRLPDVRRERVVPDPGTGDAARPSTSSAQRSPACRDGGRPFLTDAAAGAGAGARAPVARRRRTTRTAAGAGRGRRPDAGRRWPSARRTRPAFYRELTAALRSGLAGDRAPLLRLVAEATGGGTDAGDPRRLQRGARRRRRLPRLPAALRHDRAARRSAQRQYAAALADATAPTPAPTGRSRSASTPPPTGRSSTGAPTGRSRPPTTRPARRRRPAAATRDVPVLVLSGELDSITTPAEGATWSPTSSRTPGRCWSATASTSPPSATPTTARSGSCGPSCARPARRAGRSRLRRRRRSRSARSAVFPRDLGGAAGRGPGSLRARGRAAPRR